MGSDENSGSGSETDSGLDVTEEDEEEKEKVKEKEDEDLLAGSRDAGDANESKVKATLDGDADDTIEKFEPADAGEERKEVEAIRSNNEGKKEDEIQNPGPIEVSSKVDEDEEAAFNNAPTSLEAAQAAEDSENKQSGAHGDGITEAEKLAALSSDSSSSEDSTSSSDDGGF